MAIALTIVLWATLALATICLAALLLPVRIEMHIRTEPRLRYGMILRPFFGRGPGFSVTGAAWRKRKPPRKQKSRTSRVSAKRGRAMIRAAPDLLRGLLDSVRLETLRLDATFGTDDPADTGHLFGFVSPVLYGLPPSDKYHVRLRPDFNGPVFDGSFEAHLRVLPFWIAGTLVRFGWRVFWPGR